jgi:hypothetical protein
MPKAVLEEDDELGETGLEEAFPYPMPCPSPFLS